MTMLYVIYMIIVHSGVGKVLLT